MFNLKKMIMKKILLFCSALCLLAFTGNAQTQVINENFESQVVPGSSPYNDVTVSGWINNSTEGNRNWQAREYSSNKYAQATAYGNTNPDPTNVMWLITSAINMDNYTGETFTFDYNSGYDNGFALAVLHSNNFDGDTNHILTATWNDITSSFTIPTGPSGAYGTIANVGNYNASSLSGTVNFAFRYTGSKTGITTTVQVDNVILTGTVNIGKIAIKNIEIFPNPTVDVLSIKNINNLKSVAIVDITGKEVFKSNDVNSEVISIDFSTFASGIYFLNLTNTDNVVTSQKIVKK